MSELCLVRPANSPAATELARWGASLKSDITASSHTVRVDLYAAAGTRAAVEAQLGPSRATVFFGHGRNDRLEGYCGDVIDTSNIGKATGNILIAIACWSVVKLGPSAIAAGVEAFVGFDDQLVWLAGDPDGQFEPATLSGAREMLNAAATVAACAAKMQSEFDAVFAFYRTGLGAGKRNSVLGWLAASWGQGSSEEAGHGQRHFVGPRRLTTPGPSCHSLTSGTCACPLRPVLVNPAVSCPPACAGVRSRRAPGASPHDYSFV